MMNICFIDQTIFNIHGLSQKNEKVLIGNIESLHWCHRASKGSQSLKQCLIVEETSRSLKKHLKSPECSAGASKARQS